MKHSLYITIIVISIVSLTCSCKKQNKDLIALQRLVEQVNTKEGTELSNGTLLTKCEYKEGDSLLTYYIKVKDKRFDKSNIDSIKQSLLNSMDSTGMKKVKNLLVRNSIGLRYVYDTEDKDITIVFSPDELSSKY